MERVSPNRLSLADRSPVALAILIGEAAYALAEAISSGGAPELVGAAVHTLSAATHSLDIAIRLHRGDRPDLVDVGLLEVGLRDAKDAQVLSKRATSEARR